MRSRRYASGTLFACIGRFWDSRKAPVHRYDAPVVRVCTAHHVLNGFFKLLLTQRTFIRHQAVKDHIGVVCHSDDAQVVDGQSRINGSDMFGQPVVQDRERIIGGRYWIVVDDQMDVVMFQEIPFHAVDDLVA